MFVYTIQPVVKQVWQPVVSCKRGFSFQMQLENVATVSDETRVLRSESSGRMHWKLSRCSWRAFCWWLITSTQERLHRCTVVITSDNDVASSCYSVANKRVSWSWLPARRWNRSRVAVAGWCWSEFGRSLRWPSLWSTAQRSSKYRRWERT